MRKMSKTYAGTEGLDFKIAIKRIFELMDKQPLGAQDEEFYKESKNIIEKEIDDMIRDCNTFRIVEQNLTTSQWRKIYHKEKK